MAYVYMHTRLDTNEVFYFDNKYFERPTKEEISKKLGLLRIGNQNWKGNKKTLKEKQAKTKKI